VLSAAGFHYFTIPGLAAAIAGNVPLLLLMAIAPTDGVWFATSANHFLWLTTARYYNRASGGTLLSGVGQSTARQIVILRYAAGKAELRHLLADGEHTLIPEATIDTVCASSNIWIGQTAGGALFASGPLAAAAIWIGTAVVQARASAAAVTMAANCGCPLS